MMTVVHYLKGKRHRRYAYVLVNGKAHWPEAIGGKRGDSAYACGMRKPHYPVPATIGPVFIFDDYVAIARSDIDIVNDPLNGIVWECWAHGEDIDHPSEGFEAYMQWCEANKP